MTSGRCLTLGVEMTGPHPYTVWTAESGGEMLGRYNADGSLMSLADDFRARGIGAGDWIEYQPEVDPYSEAGERWQVQALGQVAALIGRLSDEISIGATDSRFRDYDDAANWQPASPPVPVTWTDGTDERWGTPR